MKKTLIFLLIVGVIAYIVFGKKKEYLTGGVNKIPMTWLAGKWATVEPFVNSASEEWVIENDSVLRGEAYVRKKDSLPKLFETLVISKKLGSYCYTVKGVGVDSIPVDFAINTFSDTGFVAVNMQHDYPKRIVYRLINKDSINAYIDDAEPNSVNKIQFNYKRIKQ